ncbi:hypothetical protein [Roseofilum casamattae]|uniref:Uncharacterized protein n=1 Tax=Roseofilum casamattae BLCC-M143 TaxID=3022442 RepID=A0ABT7C0V2_9CYAN|nr:hypothetical protein [Roseofilum casamattae]MDJ1184940.1 hypothetical protein [Roseofilum casamattae BLCC-M143]
MSNNYINQAWSLANEYFCSNGIDASKLVDHELVRAYLKACQKSTPKGVSISKQGNRLYLRFKTATKPATANNGCNESFTRDGCVNALAKALSVSDTLGASTSESEFWEWYESEIKEVKTLENDIITIGQAIDKVKADFFDNFDKCGRKRGLGGATKASAMASYDDAYGRHHRRLDKRLPLTAQSLIEQVDSIWGHLGYSSGFRTAKSSVCKLLRAYGLSDEVSKFNAHFKGLRSPKKRGIQVIDLESFLDFRARVLGINGYTLTPKQQDAFTSRQSWFKAFCINLLYGFRASEFKAVLNYDEPVTIDGYTFKALHDPTNTENILVLGDGFWVTDTAGEQHWMTIRHLLKLLKPVRVIFSSYFQLGVIQCKFNDFIKV